MLILLFFSSLSAKNYTHNLSICAMFKDDADYLKEWIEYHRLLGVQHFWLYDNGSSDQFLEILLPYMNQGIVELTSWPSISGKNWITVQHKAYHDCIRRCKDKTKWLAVIDSDEFIVPVVDKNGLNVLLNHFEKKPDCGGVVLSWLMFGTGFIYDIPEDKTLVEMLLLRSNTSYDPNHHVKTICRPDRVRSFHIHSAEYLPGFTDYTVDGSNNNSSSHSPVFTEPVRINHYWMRTGRYFQEVKIPRRVIFNSRTYSDEEIAEFDTDLNAEHDGTILQYVPELRKRLGFKD